jgi:hypothetical protein
MVAGPAYRLKPSKAVRDLRRCYHTRRRRWQTASPAAEAAPGLYKNIENNPMQSSLEVAGMSDLAQTF